MIYLVCPQITRINESLEAIQFKNSKDSAQGFGGKIGEDFATSFGDISTTSFFPAKPLGCYVDGGAIFTNCDEYAEIIDSLRVHGKGLNKYDNVRVGMNSRLDTLQAAVLLEKLKVLDAEIIARQELAEYYEIHLKNYCITPVTPENYRSSWAQYTILTDDRDKCIERLTKKNIPSAIYYEKCIYQQPVYTNNTATCARAEMISEKCCLPMHIYKDSRVLIKLLTVVGARPQFIKAAALSIVNLRNDFEE